MLAYKRHFPKIQKRLLLTEFCVSYLARCLAMSTLRFKINRIDFFSRQNRFVARCLVREQLMWLNIKITPLIMTLFFSRLLLKCQFRLALVCFSTSYSCINVWCLFYSFYCSVFNMLCANKDMCNTGSWIWIGYDFWSRVGWKIHVAADPLLT